MTATSPTDILRQAHEHHRAGRFEEAITLYRQVLALQPNNADAAHLLGLAVFHAGHG